jgi:hypothetical protein
MTSEQTRRRRVTVDVRLLPSRRSVPFLAPARLVLLLAVAVALVLAATVAGWLLGAGWSR